MTRTAIRLIKRLRSKGLLRPALAEGAARLVKPRWDRRPVFIMGPPSSGSTWLGALLGGMPGRVFYHENKLTNGRSGRALVAVDRYARFIPRRLLHASFEVIQRGHLWTLDIHTASLRGRSENLEPENLGPLDLTRPHETSADLDIVDTAGGHLFLATLLRRAYPHATFIFLIRDPRDVIASLTLRKRFGHRRDWAGWAQGYMDLYRAFERVEGHDQILVVRYEDLLADTFGELTRILEWSGLPVDDDVLKATVERNDAATVRASSRPRGNLDAARAGGWRDELPAEQVAEIDAMCAPLIDRWGYR